MLDLSAVDLDALGEALEDHSDYLHWFVDPDTGEVLLWTLDSDEPNPEDRGAYYVQPIPSYEAYNDLQDFTSRVSDRRAADLLTRAIEGRGAFRRFKDTLFEFPQLREAWFIFHDTRMRRRAVEWLGDVGLIDETSAAAALETLEDPPADNGATDPLQLGRDLAVDLLTLFGPRLVDVVVFGSQATGEATDDSDLDVAVVLRDVRNPWEDGRRMDETLWQRTLESGITVSAVVVDESDWQHPAVPLLRIARAAGSSVV
jgi:hypothetical protein